MGALISGSKQKREGKTGGWAMSDESWYKKRKKREPHLLKTRGDSGTFRASDKATNVFI